MGRTTEAIKAQGILTRGAVAHAESRLHDRLDKIEAEVGRVSAGVSVIGAISEIGAGDARRAAEQTEVDPVIEAVTAAIGEHVVISFPYIGNSGQTSTRVISPYEIKLTQKGTRVVGWDHVRNGFRQYSLVGIRAVPCIEPRYEYRENPEG